MVDLHQKEPGLAEGHPWLRLSRWSMCWRVTLSSAVVGMLGVLVLGLIGLADSNHVNIVSGATGALFGLIPSPIFGGLAAILGPWLRRFFPFSQGIVFGFLGSVACALALLVLDGIGSAMKPCPPSMGCFPPLSGALLIVMFAGLPLAVMAGVGLTTAIHVSNSRRRSKIFIALLAATGLVFFAVQAVGLMQ